MSSIQTTQIVTPTGLDIVVDGTTVAEFLEDSVTLNVTNKNWFVDIIGANVAIGGSGAVAQAILDLGGARKFNAWELVNSGSANAYLAVQFWLPPDYDGSALKVSLYLVKTATATGTAVVTRTALECIGTGDTLAAAVAQTAAVTTSVGSNNCLFVAEQTVTPDNAADGGLCHGYIQRRSTDASDNYTGSIYLLGARVEYA